MFIRTNSSSDSGHDNRFGVTLSVLRRWKMALNLEEVLNVDHKWPRTLTERFHQVVSAFPDSVATKDAHKSLAYDELSRLFALYARTLLRVELVPGVCITVLCEAGVNIYAIMFANLSMGAVHVPLDVSLPAERRLAVVAVCEPDVIVFHDPTSEATEECSAKFEIGILNLSKLRRSS
jgi:non-ribosomal peptide synthetase component F